MSSPAPIAGLRGRAIVRPIADSPKGETEMSATTTTTHLASQMAGQQSDVSKAQAKATIELLFGLIVSEMKKGQKVKIAGFGMFQIKDRAARTGRNPITGEAIQIKASKKVAFRASKELKESI